MDDEKEVNERTGENLYSIGHDLIFCFESPSEKANVAINPMLHTLGREANYLNECDPDYERDVR